LCVAAQPCCQQDHQCGGKQFDSCHAITLSSS
jgi:hypothetical protein